jgi:hypothetical protein
LEKDWMPGLGVRQGIGIGEDGQTPKDGVEDRLAPGEGVEVRDEDSEEGTRGSSWGGSTALGGIDFVAVGELLRKRWDIALAGAVLVVAVGIVMGAVATGVGVLLVAVLALYLKLHVMSGPSSTAVSPQSVRRSRSFPVDPV